ncbi:MAG: glycerol kinase GlpK [Bacteroidota bacterium]
MSDKPAYIMALDQGTTSSRAIIFDHAGKIQAVAQKPFEQIFPKPGWVEHDATEIWSSQASVASEALAKLGIHGSDLAGIGITNQRETVVIWDRTTGKPIHHAIVWQDRRTSTFCDQLKEEGKLEFVREKTGLVLDAYFSATKVKWLLDHVEGARAKAEQGELAFGTIDSWLIWKFTDGQAHVTDVTNASRTLLFNIHELKWDEELLALFDIPASILPEVKSSSEIYAHTTGNILQANLPISGIAGDQHAALFGQMCLEKGMAKCTYGTGCFVVMNTGDEPVTSQNNLLTTIAWQIDGKVTYALEGSIFIGGAAVQWLRDGAKMIESAAESQALAESVDDNGGVYFVPALTGLGAPHWDQYARGAIYGLTRGTTSAHIARATLEAIDYQVYDVIKAMESDAGQPLAEMRVDGGAVANDLLMQFQADLLRTPVRRPEVLETTALGAAYLAGLAIGFWENVAELAGQWKIDRTFEPNKDSAQVESCLKHWHSAIERSKGWALTEE